MGNKILIVSDAWIPQVNGVVQTIKETVNVLERWGYQVKVIGPSNFTHFPLPSYPEIKLAIPTRHKLAKLIEEFAPSAIHIATEGPLGWATRKYCMRNKLPFTTVFHTRFPEYIHKRFKVVPIALGYKFLALFHKKATKVLIPNETMAEIFRKYGVKNLAYWVRGVDTNTFRPNKQSTTYQHPVMITICRLSPEKNLEAFFDLDIKGTKIVISGGPLFEKYKKQYPDVLFVGYKKREEVAELLNISDVFVFPSKTDTFGLVLLEALACGVPIACYKEKAQMDIVGDAKVGAFADRLEDAVKEALKADPNECRKLAMKYSWEEATKQFLDAQVFFA